MDRPERPMTDLTVREQCRAIVEETLRAARAEYHAAKFGRAPMAVRRAARRRVEAAERDLKNHSRYTRLVDRKASARWRSERAGS